MVEGKCCLVQERLSSAKGTPDKTQPRAESHPGRHRKEAPVHGTEHSARVRRVPR